MLQGALLCYLLLAGTARADELSSTIAQVLAEKPHANARVGVHVVALGSGRVVYARRADETFIPASNQKLVTGAAALVELGTEYRFETRLIGHGTLQNGTLHGDLVLQAGGDPTIGGEGRPHSAAETLKQWAAALHKHGLRRVTGDVVVDDTFLDRTFYHPSWPAREACEHYRPTVGAACLDDNLITIGVAPGPAPGRAAVVDLDPAWTPVELVNKCKTARRTHAPWFRKTPGSNRITVHGYVRHNANRYPAAVPVPNPSLYAARALHAALEAVGIAVSGEARLAAPAAGVPRPERVELYLRRTPLTVALTTMMKDSHNLTAEVVLKVLHAESGGSGTWAGGAQRAGYLLQELGFEPKQDFVIDDGSGLSRKNRLSPALLTTLLRHMASGRHGGPFAALLPVAGKSGTLEKRLTEEPYAGNVYAKTGYLSGVTGLSGYAATRSGMPVAFSILVNDPRPAAHYSKRVLREKICRAIVDHAR
jgi:PBP4 family serine-type D-alanyl-D-alanine carboxypeptidase